MNTIKYLAFVEAARCGNLTVAAENLNYTQPGISHMINALEKEFGFQLLFRSKSGVSLTENGKRLYDIFVRILDAEEDLKNTVNQIKGVMIGKIRVGAFLSVLTKWLPKVIEEFSIQYPQIELQLFEGEMIEQLDMLQKGRIDVAIFSAPVPEEYEFIPLQSDQLVAILPEGHELAQKEKISPQELIQYQEQLVIQHESNNEDVRLVYNDTVFPSKSRYTVRSDSTIVALVEKGLGIGIMSSLLISTLTANVVIRHIKASTTFICFVSYNLSCFKSRRKCDCLCRRARFIGI